MLIPILLFALGLVLLIKGGDWFVDGACGVAKRFNLPEILIGATVVAIGTTLPEVMVSSTAAVGGSGAIAYGNSIGSVICNTALISAITIAVMPGVVDRKSLGLPVAFFFGSALLYCFAAYFMGEFTRIIGVTFLVIFAVYILISAINAKKHISDVSDDPDPEEVKLNPLWKDLLLIVIGAALIAWGANLLVDNGIKIATALGVPQTVIALTFVALGTSLPELVTAITSLAKGHGNLSLGNVIGANLFNIVLVSGASVTLSPFAVPAEKTFMGYNTSLLIELPLMMFVMALLTVPAIIKGKLYRWQGIVLLVIYAAFCIFQFV